MAVKVELEQKILTGLAKIAIVLRETSWKRSADFGINPSQMQVLLCLQEDASETLASDISLRLGITRASVSDSLKALEEKGLLRRRSHSNDARASLIELTAKGKKIAKELDHWPGVLTESLQALEAEEQAQLLHLLSKTILGLQENRKVPLAKMCVSCTYFRQNQHLGETKPHHCALIDAPLANEDLRLNCPEHVKHADVKKQ